MMVWYKAWMESRVRFLLSAATIGAACAGVTFFHPQIRIWLASSTTPLTTDAAYIYRAVYQGFVRTLFMTFAFILGLGGLLREREHATAPFTLTLPVSRLRLVVVRAASGLFQLAILAFLPALVIAALSPLGGLSYPASQTLQFALLWLAGGSALFATAFLGSCLFGGEYTAFVVSWVAQFGVTVGTQFIRIKRPAMAPYLFTVHEIMSGFRMSYFDPGARLLIGPFPVTLTLVLGAIACVLIAAAVVYTERGDF
jgi:ABC-type transport system involved in multi-copper enzyme maturation permease subunit